MAFEMRSSAFEDGEEIPVTPTGGWVDDSLRFGLLVYLGRADVIDPLGFAEEDRFWRVGADAKGKYGDLAIGGGVVFGNNDDPYATISDQDVDSRVWFAEGEYFAYPWLIGTLRYESLSLDEPAGLFATGQDRARVVPSITMLLRANVKFVVEALLHTKHEALDDVPGGEKNDADAFVVRMDFAF